MLSSADESGWIEAVKCSPARSMSCLTPSPSSFGEGGAGMTDVTQPSPACGAPVVEEPREEPGR